MAKVRSQTISNSVIAEIFSRVADILEIEGANTFRVRAYRNAADIIGRMPNNIADMVKNDEPLTKIHGIGPDLAEKIKEIVETGNLKQLKEIEQRTPSEMVRLLKIGGLGPRRVMTLYVELGVKNVKDLQKAAEQGKIRALSGFGEKIERNILADLHNKQPGSQRFRIDKAEKIIAPLIEYLHQSGKIEELEIAGSYRRRKETVGDIDILAISEAGGEVIDHFARYPGVREVMMQGETRSTVILSSGLQVDLRVVPRKNYGAAMLYFTGSKPHNLHLRLMAIERGWKNNEYGLFEGEKQIAGETEEGMYQALGLPWITPELREDNGEIEAAQQERLPELVTLADIRGDLQSHTRGSDGRAGLETMANTARGLGYSYLAITDHSQSLRTAHGQSNEALARQMDEIDRLNENWNDFRLLKSCEVDILEDGSLDLPDEILARLDLCVCSIHSLFSMPREKQTERILRAMDNPYFNIFAHPTGRLLNQRPGYEIDLERILIGAKQRGCFLEINAHPERLDLNDTAARLAKNIGVKLAISTDAHSPSELDYMHYGVEQARRGWLETGDVLNTRSWEALGKLLDR